MAKYKEVVYLCLDELKLAGDDSYITEDHVIFLLGKYRYLLLKQKIEKEKIENNLSESNYQTLCLNLEQTDAIGGFPCEGSYLRTTQKIPYAMTDLDINLSDQFGTEITFVSPKRLKQVGYNRWLQKIIYAAVGTDRYLYLKSANPQYYYLENIQVKGIFEDPEEVAQYECDKSETEEESCDILDKDFPLEDDLLPQCIQLVVKELSGVVYRPKDATNSASDDLSDLYTFIKHNMKSSFQKQMEDD